MNGHDMLKRDFLSDLSPREGMVRRVALLAAKRAAKSPGTLAVLGLAVMSTLLWNVPLALAAVPVVVAILFFVNFRSSRTWSMAARVERDRPFSLPDLVSYSDTGAQAAIRRLDQARQRLAIAVRQSPYDSDHGLVARLAGVSEIERRIVVLAARVEYLGTFLARISLPELEADVQRLREKESSAASDEARAKYRLGVEQREAHLGEAKALEVRREQLLAAIDYMLGTLEMLPLKLTRLQLLRVEAVEDSPTDPATETASLFNDLGAIEEVFDARAT